MEVVNCCECLKETSDYYKIVSNTGSFHRCRDCYEIVFQREVREEHMRNPSEKLDDSEDWIHLR